MTDYKTILITIADALYRQAGYVPFPWAIEDVRKLAEDAGVSVTDAECFEVLDNASDNYDASLGMSWDVLETELETLLEHRDDKGGQP